MTWPEAIALVAPILCITAICGFIIWASTKD